MMPAGKSKRAKETTPKMTQNQNPLIGATDADTIERIYHSLVWTCRSVDDGEMPPGLLLQLQTAAHALDSVRQGQGENNPH